VAAAISDELRHRDVLTDPDRAAAMLDLLGHTGRPEDRRLVERLVLASGPPTLVSGASRAIGRFSDGDDEFWRRAVGQHGRAWRRSRAPLHETVLRRLVHAFGVIRREALLQETARDTELPPSTRQAATWWMNQSTLVRSSALE
jgi:hypothetical protein